jgi:hypothetical protein
VLAAVVLALTSLGGSSGKSATSSTAGTVASAGKTRSTAHRRASSKPASKAGSPAANPAETTVAVLNATETTGLAHRISGDLQQGGYSQAQALNGRPPGTGQVSVVEYASGHQAEAEGVARSLSVKKVQPLESAVAALAGSAQVVVIVGADKATTVP